MINAGKYNKPIKITRVVAVKNERGFPVKRRNTVLQTYAAVKTTRGYTLIANNSDFEKAYTNFTIRYPKTEISRDMEVEFGGKIYTIEYLNDVDENGVELEMQCKEVEH